TPLWGAVTRPGPVDITVTAGQRAISKQTSLGISEQKTIEVFFGEAPARVGPGVCPLPERICRPTPKGFLTLGLKPDGTVHTSDGKKLGDTPMVRFPMAPGDHALILRSADGRQSRRVRISIEAGQTAVFRFRLTAADRVRTDRSPP
ncbi:MAG: hypothetical protein AAFV29_20925, partial [Myxococcota bacterium]